MPIETAHVIPPYLPTEKGNDIGDYVNEKWLILKQVIEFVHRVCEGYVLC